MQYTGRNDWSELGAPRYDGDMSRRSRVLLRSVLLLGLLCIAWPACAEDVPPTRMITLRWSHEGDVAGFKVYNRFIGRPYGKGVDIGLPEKVDGVYTHEVEVSNMDASYVALTSYNSSRVESKLSNEKRYLLD
jgi:hypothetical protein